MSRHETRQRLAREFGATDIVTERGDEGVAAHQRPHQRPGGALGVEAVGTQESMMQAIQSTRPGGHVGYVGVTHDVTSRARICSCRMCTCTVDPRRYAGSCPI